MKVKWTAVADLSSAITDFTEFLRAFRNKIQPDGTLEDRASPELARIRREMERQRRTIQESLRGYLRRLAEGGAVQDELITIRGERFVIPIKIEQKRRVQGVVHGASSSGQTVFVEPLETIEQNNELVRLLDEEQAEIHRILLEMTRRIGESSELIRRAADVLGELELQFAKARFAEDYRCVPVLVGENSRLILINARHPAFQSRRTAPSCRCLMRCWPISATTSPSSRIFRRFPPTSPTLISFRAPRLRSRWCCWMNWARPPIRKKEQRWRWPSPSISGGSVASR